MKNETPYAIRFFAATLMGDVDLANDVIKECFGDVGDKCIQLIHQYDSVDLPLVLAAMIVMTSGMKMTLDQSAIDFITDLVERTECIAIDLGAIKKHFGGVEDGKS